MPNNEQPKNQIIMPNSVEAEQNVLCCILRSPEMQLEIIAQLQAQDFYQPNHQIIFQAMKDISNQTHSVGDGSSVNTANLATVMDYLRRVGKLEQVGDVEYIARLNELLPSTANFDEYVSIVKRASTMRQLIVICDEVKSKAYTASTAEDAITYAEEKIFALSQGGSNGGLVLLADDTARTMHNINERFVNPGKFRGIETGFTRFDRLTNGLHGGELIVLAARPGVGKSAMAMNIVENVAKQGKTVAIFSLEMSNEQIIERLMSSMSGVPLEYIKSGQLPNGEADLEKLRIAQDTICSKMKMYGNDYASIKPSEIASQCRRLKQQHGLDLVVIDYIQLMGSSADAKQGRQQEVAAISRALKLLAKELNVPVIALSQLKRDAEIRNIKGKENPGGGGGEPVLSDLRESGAIEQDADIVLFIHKEEVSGVMKYSLIVAKHRNGEQGKIELFWLGKIVRYVDAEYLTQHGIQMGQVVEQPAEGDQDDDMQFGESIADFSELDEEGGFVDSSADIIPEIPQEE